jgi:hypothetical protein
VASPAHPRPTERAQQIHVKSAWGPGADRPHKRLIDFVSVGSMFGAGSQLKGRNVRQRSLDVRKDLRRISQR